MLKYKARIHEKPMVIEKPCYNKQFWCAFSVCFLLCIPLLFGHYSCFSSSDNNGTASFPIAFSGDLTSHGNQRNQCGDGRNKTEITVQKSSIGEIRIPVKSPSSDSCSNRYIYIHDIPSRFNDDIIKNCSSLNRWIDMCKSLLNMGIGPLVYNSNGILQGKGWFVTNQFTLEIIFHSRMKQYKCLTSDSSLASAIYVPFYAGLDVGRYLWDGSNTSVRDSASIDLMNWLRGRQEWKNMWGRDHFFVAGRITWDFRRQRDEDYEWGNKLMELPEAKNMTMLVIESSPWSNKDFAVPYPTYFHPAGDVEIFEWQDKMRRQKRSHLFSFIGAPRPKMIFSIRGEIIKQCVDSGKKCKLLHCDPITDLCNNPIHVMKHFQSSIFCLQPPGDSYTRRSVFDSIVAGCIPVFFHPGSAYIQYIWHLPKNYTQYSVFISEHGIRDGKANIEKILREIPKDKVSAMREEVIRLIPSVIYSNPRSRLETVKDAFDISIDRVLERVGTIRREMKEAGRSSSFDFPEENSWKHYLSGNVGDTDEWDSFFTKPDDVNSSVANRT